MGIISFIDFKKYSIHKNEKTGGIVINFIENGQTETGLEFERWNIVKIDKDVALSLAENITELLQD